MQSLSFPSRQKQPLISLRHRVPSFPWIRWIIHGAADHGNIRWKQRFSHPRPAARFSFFFLLMFFQWRGRIVSECSCSAQPAYVNRRLLSSILVNCLWQNEKETMGSLTAFTWSPTESLCFPAAMVRSHQFQRVRRDREKSDCRGAQS